MYFTRTTSFGCGYMLVCRPSHLQEGAVAAVQLCCWQLVPVVNCCRGVDAAQLAIQPLLSKAIVWAPAHNSMEAEVDSISCSHLLMACMLWHVMAQLGKQLLPL
jgi:hypothetical protein